MTYNFKCPKCKEDFEIRESMANIERLKPMCPKCEVHMTRMYNSPGIHFKGFGWTVGANKDKVNKND